MHIGTGRKSVIAALAAITVLASGRTQAQSPGGRPSIPAQALTEARTTGASRIIVQLSLPVSPEANLAPTDIGIQRATIAATQEGVLRRLRARTLRAARRFQYIPYVALEADESE